ncbi:hypothetical protein [Nocardia gipuzkoensis]
MKENCSNCPCPCHRTVTARARHQLGFDLLVLDASALFLDASLGDTHPVAVAARWVSRALHVILGL